MSDKRITVWVQAFPDREALQLQWLDPDTGRRKTRSSRTADPKEAEAARKDLEYELTHGKYEEASRMTWERFRKLFEAEYLTGKRKNTRRGYQSAFELFEKICNPRTLKNISERTISLYVAGLRKEPGRRVGSDGMMASSIKVYLQGLHTALTWAVHQKMIPARPRFPVVKVPKTRPQAVPPESFERLIDKTADTMMRAYLFTGWLAGLRLAEAATLEWQATDEAPYLDLGRDRIILPAGFVKGVEDQWVPLDPKLRCVLEALPRDGQKVFRFTTKGGQPIAVRTISGRIIALAKQAGVKLTMRSLRRGFGCRYAGKVPAQVLQKLMRHSSITTTMGYYANVDAAVEEAVLGVKRNTLRNTSTESAHEERRDDGANAYHVEGNSDDQLFSQGGSAISF